MENPMNKKEFWDALSTTPWENRNCANCKHYDPYTYETDLKIVAHHSRVVRVRDCFTNEVYAEKDQKTNKLTWFF